MKAQHILSRWERIAPMLQAQKRKANLMRADFRINALTLWLGMLYCATGSLSAGGLAAKLKMTVNTARVLLRLLQKNGLVCHNGFLPGATRPSKVYDPTPRLFEALGVQPEDSTQTTKVS